MQDRQCSMLHNYAKTVSLLQIQMATWIFMAIIFGVHQMETKQLSIQNVLSLI